MSLSEHTKKLYRLSAKLNLYISSDIYKNNPDNLRVKRGVDEIKEVMAEIEELLTTSEKTE